MNFMDGYLISAINKNSSYCSNLVTFVVYLYPISLYRGEASGGGKDG